MGEDGSEMGVMLREVGSAGKRGEVEILRGELDEPWAGGGVVSL